MKLNNIPEHPDGDIDVPENFTSSFFFITWISRQVFFCRIFTRVYISLVTFLNLNLQIGCHYLTSSSV
jgi:hypothetical protein